MDDTAAAPDADQPAPEKSAAAKAVAPVAALVAAWGVRKALDSAYRGTTGKEPPRANDPEHTLRQVLVWAAISAAALAVVNVVIDRAMSRWN